MYVLVGENEFLKRERLAQLLEDVKGEVERIDGEELEVGDLRELLQGQTLFSSSRVIVISGLSLSPAWSSLPDIAKGSEGLVVLVEQKIDKRTSVYKWLKKQVNVEEFAPIGERDSAKVVDWCVGRAKSQHGFELQKPFATRLVERLGHDQLRIDQVLEQLGLADEVSQELIDNIVPLPRMESVFGLLEAALAGNRKRVQEIIGYLELESGAEGAYQTLGLLISQLVPLNALVLGGSAQEVTEDFGTHPFVVRNLAPLARNLTPEQIKGINAALSRADMALKTTQVSPWLLLETALVEVSQLSR